MIYYFILLLVSIPKIDKEITLKIMSLKKYHYFSHQFSDYIIVFNIVVNLMLLFNISLYKLFFRYFVEHFIINFLFKMLLDRPRPKESLIKHPNRYKSIFDIRLSNNININKSFPSGHISTLYLTSLLLLYNNYFCIYLLYLFIIFITIFARINSGNHHISDCLWALFICQQFKNYLH